MKPLSEADKERARNQKIPKLSELLELAQKEKKLVIFDLRRILSITLLKCEMSVTENSLALPFFGIGMKLDLF